MKLEIKLDDPKSCDSCPSLKVNWHTAQMYCNQGIFKDKLLRYVVVRPQECIEKNGE